jgi:hypothetical protein
MSIEFPRPLETSSDRLLEGRDVGTPQPDVNSVVSFFEQREQFGKPVPGKSALIRRLEDLSSGESIPIVVFNCIGFTYTPDTDRVYPAAVPSRSGSSSIVDFYKNDLNSLVREVTKLGDPDIQIIVPDSEFDRRVLNIPLEDAELKKTASEIKSDLSNRLQELPATVSLLSEYNEKYGLLSPESYTEQNYSRIREFGAVKKKHIKAERQYFSRNNIGDDYLESVADETIAERLMWYYGMYAGEGEAMRDSGAIVINLEDDGRVPTWLQRGASQTLTSTDGDVLPIITPVRTKEFVLHKRTKNQLQP